MELKYDTPEKRRLLAEREVVGVDEAQGAYKLALRDHAAPLEAQLKAKDELLQRLVKLLNIAKCPNCDGSGSYAVPLGEHYVSREMAMDAGDPSMEGMSMGVEYGQEQCQWCDERTATLPSPNF